VGHRASPEDSRALPRENWWRRGESEHCGLLKTRNLLITGGYRTSRLRRSSQIRYKIRYNFSGENGTVREDLKRELQQNIAARFEQALGKPPQLVKPAVDQHEARVQALYRAALASLERRKLRHPIICGQGSCKTENVSQNPPNRRAVSLDIR
jgi:hypothetical protein